MSAIVAAIVAPVVALALALVFGNGVADRWAEIRQRRDLDLAALERFYHLYGEFFAVWKSLAGTPQSQDDDLKRQLWERICIAEGELEVLFVRIASKTQPCPREIDCLGSFRQGYQRLREQMAKGSTLPSVGWGGSDPQFFREYAAFKGLALEVARMLDPGRAKIGLAVVRKRPEPLGARTQREILLGITSNEYKPGNEKDWVKTAERYELLPPRDHRPSDTDK